MSTATTTIRIPVQTRDRLAVQARARGISVPALLTELVAQFEREAIFRAERHVTRSEAAAEAVRDENRDWDSTIGDGIA
jgi:hypothetical protein